MTAPAKGYSSWERHRFGWVLLVSLALHGTLLSLKFRSTTPLQHTEQPVLIARLIESAEQSPRLLLGRRRMEKDNQSRQPLQVYSPPP